MNVTTVTARQAARPGGRANTLLWAAQIVLAVFFAFAAVPKLAGAHTAVTMFGQIGAGQWLRYLVGTAELAALTMTVPLCAAFTLIATTRRAQIRNLAAAITRRRQPLARPQAFRQNDQDRRPS